VLVVCSAEEYGYVKPGDLQWMSDAFASGESYSVSKIAQDFWHFSII